MKASFCVRRRRSRKRGMPRVMLICDEDNEASRRTIERNGGIFHSSIWREEEKATVRRYWIGL